MSDLTKTSFLNSILHQDPSEISIRSFLDLVQAMLRLEYISGTDSLDITKKGLQVFYQELLSEQELR